MMVACHNQRQPMANSWMRILDMKYLRVFVTRFFLVFSSNNNNNNDLYLYRLSLSVLICFVQGLRPATIIERKINMAHILNHIHGKLPLSLPLP